MDNLWRHTPRRPIDTEPPGCIGPILLLLVIGTAIVIVAGWLS